MENIINWKQKLRTQKDKFPVKIFRILTKGKESFMLGVIKIENLFIIGVWDINGIMCSKPIIDDYFYDLENSTCTQ